MTFAERYILPGQFPDYSSIASPVDSTRTLPIHVPGGPYVFSGLTQSHAAALPDRFTRLGSVTVSDEFVQKDATFVSIETIHQPIFKEVVYRNGEYTLDFDYGASLVRIAGRNFAAHLDLNPQSRSVLWVSSRAGIEFREIFENFFRILVAYRLLRMGGILFHSAAVVDGDKAYVFFGRSGAGKTTVSRLLQSEGSSVLSDDLNALTTTAKGVRIAQLPFCGDLGDSSLSTASYNVSGIFHLRKQDQDAIVNMSDAYSLQVLLGCCPFVNRDPHRYDILLSSLLSVLRHGTVRALTFTPTKKFIQIIRNWDDAD